MLRGFDLLQEGILPWVDLRMSMHAPAGRDWLDVWAAEENQRFGTARRYTRDDVRFLLRVVTERWQVFKDDLDRPQSALATELRDIANRLHHGERLSADDTYRALDTMERLLIAIGATDESDKVGALRAVHLQEIQEPQATLRREVASGTALLEPTDEALVEPVAEPVAETAVVRVPGGPGVPDPGLPAGQSQIVLLVGDLEVRVTYRSRLNYALIVNDLPAVLSATVHNRGTDVVDAGEFQMSLHGVPGAEDVAPLTLRPGHLGPQQVFLLPNHQLGWALSPALFAHLDEATPAELRLTDPQHGLSANGPISLLAADQWDARSAPETLAAFVRPRDPSVAGLLAEAADLLAARTNNPSVDGYQGGAERAGAIVEAIYDALAARGVRYIEPPASFEAAGQKIRPHREVLEGRWGTCLDLATTFAAVLESAGINSVLVVTRGHAFCGWLQDEDLTLPGVVVQERDMFVNVADAASFDAVELTSATVKGAGESTPFETARGQARAWWRQRLDEVRWMIDVRAAHRTVRPLPIVRSAENGELGVVEVEVETPKAPARYVPRRPETLPASEYPERIDQWRRSLLDLANTNPLLNRTPTRTSGVDLHVPTSYLGVIEDQLVAGATFRLIAHDEITALHKEQGARNAGDIEPGVLGRILEAEKKLFATISQRDYGSRLQKLQRRARTEQEETGSNALFLALGSVVFTDERRSSGGRSLFGRTDSGSASAKEYRAPIFLLPVRLEGRKAAGFQLVTDNDEAGALPNESLHEKLRTQFGLVIPELAHPDADASGVDVARTLEAVRAAILRANVPGVRVEEDAHLGVFAFATLEMWRDLTDHWRTFVRRPVVQHLVERPGEAFTDALPEPGFSADAEATAYLPIAADSSQIEAIRWAAAGKSFVLEGPPGTGKSQTITNLIAHCLAEGKRVLFVAEKQAALEVVRRRLDSVGLGPYCLDLHGKKLSAVSVRSQLTDALNARAASSASFDSLRADYRSVTESLAKYPGLVHDKGPGGSSAYEARQVVLQMEDNGSTSGRKLEYLPEVPRDVILAGDTDRLVAASVRLGDAVSGFPGLPSSSVWRLSGGLGGLDGIPADSAEAVRAAVERLFAVDAAVPAAPVRHLVGLARTLDELDAINAWLATVAHGLPVAPVSVRGVVDGRWRAWAKDAAAALETFRTNMTPALGVFTHAAIRVDLDAQLAASEAADKKLIKKKHRLAVIQALAPVIRPGAVVDPTTLTTQIRALLTARDEAARIDQYLATIPGLVLPYGWNPLADDAAAVLSARLWGMDSAAALGDGLGSDRQDDVDRITSQVLALAGHSEAVAPAVIRDLAEAWRALFEVLNVTESDLVAWQAGRSLAAALSDYRGAWQADLRAHFLELGRWDAVRTAATALTQTGHGALASASIEGQIIGEDIEYSARLAVARAQLDERLDTTGLRFFDASRRKREVERFLTTGQDVRERLRAELPARIVAARTFDPSRPTGRVGEFVTQLGRKRQAMSVRSLFKNYGSIITQVTPCVMMSPGSVAKYLEPEAVDFDLVVFDEASQIRVPDAIGAMGRASAVVVVGDSEQMPPSSAFQIGSTKDDDDEGTSAALAEDVLVRKDEQSVLDQANQSGLPKLALTWHYRSTDEALVAFSNKTYYKDGLATFPAPPDRESDTGLHWRYIADGRWEGGTRGARVNRAEAAAVVAEVHQLLADDPSRSIGVVTFNMQQATLIQDQLEASPDRLLQEALLRDDERLFVKNLENVQGDERDVILFTLAFSKNEAGKVPLNWGPLTRDGGEKRLNVAITRAKQKVVVFSSFQPRELDISGSSSKGLAHLKDYLIQAAEGAERAGLGVERAKDLHLDDVARALREAGLEVSTHLGLSSFTVDLAVRAADRPWIAVMLDGPGWFSRKTVGDRDGLPKSVLVGAQGWAVVESVWLPMWLQDRAAAVQQIVTVAEKAEQRSRPAATPRPPVEAPVPEELFALQSVPSAEIRSLAVTEAAPADAPLPGQELFVAARAEVVGSTLTLDNLEYQSNRDNVYRAILEVAAAEGPVLADRLGKVVAQQFGLSRVRQNRIDSIVALVPPRAISVSANGDRVVWPAGGGPADYTTFRVPTATDTRAVTDIPYEELRNAMIAHVRVAHGMRELELLRAVGRTFGTTLSAKVRERLEDILDAAVREGRLRRDHDHIEEGPRS
ncbi:DUF3320 domain-containing protein [Myceligenerans crystallogenes]|uniref:DUF3320 domain-containing protein n=1 Tax=Myceligenerans crystallogenes TaxID=316335 RepID=A0ABN2NMR0_9MICO